MIRCGYMAITKNAYMQYTYLTNEYQSSNVALSGVQFTLYAIVIIIVMLPSYRHVLYIVKYNCSTKHVT
jgi:hypothetical protein